jgi:hypothetical protein
MRCRMRCVIGQGSARRMVKNTPLRISPAMRASKQTATSCSRTTGIARDQYGTTIAQQKCEFGLLPPPESPLSSQPPHVIDSSLKARTGSFVLMCLPYIFPNHLRVKSAGVRDPHFPQRKNRISPDPSAGRRNPVECTWRISLRSNNPIIFW